MPGHRVLTLRALDEPAGEGRRSRLWRTPLELDHVAEAKRFEVGEVETADRPSNVPERVGPFIPVGAGVGELSDANPVKNDYARSWHGGILGSMDTFIGVLEMVAWLIMVLILAAAATYLAVKITPDRSKPEDSDS